MSTRHTVSALIELAGFVERIAACVQYGTWVSEHGDCIELCASDKHDLNGLRDELNKLNRRLADALTDDLVAGESK
jgi:hypothetical protein